MSVSLIVDYLPSSKRESELFPIESQKKFDLYWLPICIESQLQWILLFQSGASFEIEDIEHIIDDLEKFKSKISEKIDTKAPNEIFEQTMMKAAQLIDKLKAISESSADISNIFIG